MKKSKPIDYAHEKNSKALLKEFSYRHPIETYNFLKELKEHPKARKMDIKISLDNPPEYEDINLSKKQIKQFINLKLHVHFRRIIISFMECFIANRSPKFVYRFNI